MPLIRYLVVWCDTRVISVFSRDSLRRLDPPPILRVVFQLTETAGQLSVHISCESPAIISPLGTIGKKSQDQ